MNSLAIVQHSGLAECEAEMEQCRDSIRRDFRRFGELLRKIRDEKLYLEQDTRLTFEAYYQQRWKIAHSHVYRLIEASQAVEISSPTGEEFSTVTNEWQARNLLHPPRQEPREFLNNSSTWSHSNKYPPESDQKEDAEPDYDSPEYQFGSDYAAATIARKAGHYGVALPDPTHYGLPEDTQVAYSGEHEFEVKVKPHVAHNSGNNEWYTPREYIDAAFEVMGGIDLDPASSSTANEVIDAAAFYTAKDDGLTKEWAGRVWMNPPYAGELIGKFTSKLCAHFVAGEVTEAIVLVNNATETGWFQEMAGLASAICFPKGRVKFWHSSKEKESAPLQGQAVIYLGATPQSFRIAFANFGFVALL